MTPLSSKTTRVIYSIVASVLIALLWDNDRKITAFLGIESGSLLDLFVRNLVVVMALFLLTAIVVKPKDVFSFLGLNGNVIKGLFFALICVAPLYIVFPIFGAFNCDVTFSRILKGCILSGFEEELLCRAFMFGLLFRYAKIGFFWAVILPALYFGSIHLYQGHDAVSSLAAFGVTFLGALYFSMMYVEWNFNLWVPIGLHILMNGAWVIFSMEGTEVAAGGLISNIMRLISIHLAIVITIWYKKRNNTKILKYPFWRF